MATKVGVQRAKAQSFGVYSGARVHHELAKALLEGKIDPVNLYELTWSPEPDVNPSFKYIGSARHFSTGPIAVEVRNYYGIGIFYKIKKKRYQRVTWQMLGCEIRVNPLGRFLKTGFTEFLVPVDKFPGE